MRTIVDAPRLHDRKLTDAELNLGEKFYYNMKSWQRRYMEQTKELELRQQIFRNMVEGTDYFKIEERLLIQELKRLTPDWEKLWQKIMDETERKYIETYPNRKK